MDLGLGGSTAVIVGGANGIGRAIAAEFATEGADVVLLDRAVNTDRRAAELAASIVRRDGTIPRVLGRQVDVTDEGAVRAAFAELGTAPGAFDHVVVAAGVGSGKFGFPFTNLEPRDWPRVLDVNLMGTVHVAHACVDTLRAKGEGTLLLISSVAGQIGSQTDPPYSAAKGAVINFGQCLAKDLAPHGIRVNTICPGMVKTELNESVWRAWHDSQPVELRQDYPTWAAAKIRNVVPLGRWQTPEDIAALAVFLASKRGRNITGQTMNVDGGFVMHW